MERLPIRKGVRGWHTGSPRAGWRVSTRYFADGAGLEPEEKWETIIFGSPWDVVFARCRTERDASRLHDQAVWMCRRAGWRRALERVGTALVRIATAPPKGWSE
jgi:hypothetical protein